MLDVNRKSLGGSLKRHRWWSVIVACLVLFGMFLSCHPGPERGAAALLASRYPRPMDLPPYQAEMIGREVLATVGYIPLMNVARDVGWVVRKKIASVRRSDPALLAQGAAASTFMEVFSEYAVAAGVASQVDSPAPGPGDVAALGILALGLLDAGLLEGALAASVGALAGAIAASITTAPPIVTAMPMATTAPTTTAPPVPITQAETEEEKNKRCKKVKDGCIAGCNSQMG